MQVRVRFFASLRDVAGRAEQVLELPAGATPESAWQALVAQRPELAPRRASLAAAVNRRYGRFDAPLADGDELAFLPPVSGG
ncbi:MAG: molybdopterin converting factor subunit 1 [Vicinamibacteria bacterium]|nr:molybdopterin converting factor subunit 1 [Vicinamibacteria bacterium]